MRDTVVSLFDDSGNLMEPWMAAGYDCLVVDIINPEYEKSGRLTRIRADLAKPFVCPIPRERIAFVSCHPPCDHLAVSGARWFKGKGLRALETSIAMFATAAEFCESQDAPYMIENPVSTISSYWRKPDHYYHPHQYTALCPEDNYTKKTSLWVGNSFIMPPEMKDKTLPPPDDRIHKASPGPTRAYFRSVTPKGFGKAVFLYNSLV